MKPATSSRDTTVKSSPRHQQQGDAKTRINVSQIDGERPNDPSRATPPAGEAKSGPDAPAKAIDFLQHAAARGPFYPTDETGLTTHRSRSAEPPRHPLTTLPLSLPPHGRAMLAAPVCTPTGAGWPVSSARGPASSIVQTPVNCLSFAPLARRGIPPGVLPGSMPPPRSVAGANRSRRCRSGPFKPTHPVAGSLASRAAHSPRCRPKPPCPQREPAHRRSGYPRQRCSCPADQRSLSLSWAYDGHAATSGPKLSLSLLPHPSSP